MNLNSKSKSKPVSPISQFLPDIIPVLKSKYLYIGLFTLIAGTGSTERKLIEKELILQSKQIIDIPLIIGGSRIAFRCN
jgi:hypothetical protein